MKKRTKLILNILLSAVLIFAILMAGKNATDKVTGNDTYDNALEQIVLHNLPAGRAAAFQHSDLVALVT